MIVDIGGGTTDIAVISLAGTVVSNSVKISSETFDQDIIRYVRKTYNVFIGEQTAEAVKIRIGSAYPRAEEKTMEIKGRNVITGLPATIKVPLPRRQTRLRTRSVPCWKKRRRNWHPMFPTAALS